MLSIITVPVWPKHKNLVSAIRHPRLLIKKLLKSLKFERKTKFYEGHPAVTRSLIEGLERLNKLFEYNPSANDLKHDCIVLSGVSALESIIDMKKRGKISRIFAGPNIVTLPNEHLGLVVSSEVNGCIVPSEWVRDKYAIICPKQQNKLIVWPAGVDANYWKPQFSKTINSKSPKILIYSKNSNGKNNDASFINKLSENKYSLKYIEYGKYKLEEYKEKLEWADIMVVLAGTESQGISMVEAWSMDVVTFVRRCSFWNSPDGVRFKASASPYLTEATGSFFSTTNELHNLVEHWKLNNFCFQPRNWVLKNMTDEICAHNLISALKKFD